MKKMNLVLAPSFGTNSCILRGLCDYLGDFFNVHFIDLPGFSTTARPLRKIDFDGFCRHFQSEMEKLALDRYIIGGISLGFRVISGLSLTGACKGVIAIEPYLDRHSLIVPRRFRLLGDALIEILEATKLYSIWRWPVFKLFLRTIGIPRNYVDLTIGHVDPRTYFLTARLLLRHNVPCPRHRLPCALLMGRQDNTINYGYVLEWFRAGTELLRVVECDLEHYPADLSRRHFAEMIPARLVENLVSLFASRYSEG